jgi:hypothetical protein
MQNQKFRKREEEGMNLRGGRTLFRFCCTVFGFALFAALTAVPPAFAQGNCLGDVGPAKSCSANDVSIAGIRSGSVVVFQGGSGDKCIEGGTFSFTATFDIKTTSNKTRSNIGIFFGTGQNNALHGTCTDAILAPTHPCANGTVTCGDTDYEELDQAIDGEKGIVCTNPSDPSTCTAGCGDTTSADNFTDAFGPGTQSATLEVDNVTCPLSGTSPCPAGSGFTGTCLALPECTSWFQPTSTMPVCESPGPNYPWQPQAIAGTSSKCSCTTLFIPVQPIVPMVTVAKSCNTTLSTGPDLTSCDEGAGDVSNNVTYHVNITNTTPAGEGGVIVDQICDSVYGTIYRSGTFTGAACPTGSIGSNGSLISGCTPSPTDIPNAGSGTCDFVAHQNENLKEVDTVTVQVHSDVSASAKFDSKPSNTVTVTSEDSPSKSSTTKGLVATESACATVRYSVDVHNSSGADENLTLSALTDSVYGDITKVGGNLLGTTCGVAVGSLGLGTLSGTTASSTNGGALPFSLTVGGSDYQCQFDGQFCGNINPAAEEFGTGACKTTTGFCSAGQPSTVACSKNSDCDLTCPGITQIDTVSSTITGDEGETVSQTITGLNVTECVQSFHSAH